MAGLLGSLLTGLALAGCSPGGRPPQMLFIAVGTSADQEINAELHEEFRERMRTLERGYRQIHPDTRFQYSLYPEDELLKAMQRRRWAGLEPDLLFVTGRTAHRLQLAGVTSPFPASAAVLDRFDPLLTEAVKSKGNSLSGLPVLMQLQVSCYDTSRLPQAPADVNALLAASASGVPIGLSLVTDNLVWSLGSLGALPALERVLRGEPVSAADRAVLAGWLAWLQNAGGQHRVSFYASQEQAETQLKRGQLAWIPCFSTSLPRLRRAMGNRLGVAPLPVGEGGDASPVNHVRVLALGRNSTSRARRAAIAFSDYTINPLVQRSITLGSQTVLPANRHVEIPVSSSQTLAALVRAREQGLQTDGLLPLMRPQDSRPAQVQALVTELVFGEVTVNEATTRLIRILQETR